jgi:hypothetical protein
MRRFFLDVNREPIMEALKEASDIWRARGKGIEVSKRCPVCEVMEKLASEDDSCFQCPISRRNMNLGCPEIILGHRELTDGLDKMVSANAIADFIDQVSSFFFNKNKE